jgi:tight adherence protein B
MGRLREDSSRIGCALTLLIGQRIMALRNRYSKPSALPEDDVDNYVFLGAVGSTILLGTMRSTIFFAERRRKILRQRLAALSAPKPTDGDDDFRLTLRKVPSNRELRSFYLLPAHLSARLSARLDIALAAAGGRVGLAHLVATGGVAAAIMIGFALIAGQFPPGLTIALGGAAGFGGPALLLRLAQSRYRRRFLEVFPDALDLITRAARAGLPVLEAIDLSTREIAPPVGTEFRRMLDEMRIGVEIAHALQQTADRIRVPEFRFFAVCLVLQRRTGGGLADTLTNLSTLIRQRRAMRLKVRALAAEAKASAVVLAMLPLFAGIGFFLMNSKMMLSLFIDPRGRFMLGVAVFSLFLGIVTMITMIRKGSG